ncbi:hypothetical protein CYMTET_10550 [Cymbomonas tetramitiformis]|uniref:Fe2OG dioxygenase domain-containing protein n=1 Tax=Cymbomonas tetramitiformis TaxID=36881 RepID=A0AAE0LE25_9CHLO|nr:hypothetical protein CYMTET_10550 [Cymbomonas tetramitiformis]
MFPFVLGTSACPRSFNRLRVKYDTKGNDANNSSKLKTKTAVAGGPRKLVSRNILNALNPWNPWARNPPKLREPSKHKITFPDGSSYEGEMRRGKLNGLGEWQSGSGDSFVGQFVNDEFEQGCFTEASGNKFVGAFKEGAYDGAGAYLYADGRVEVGLFSEGEDVGDGARWSSDGTQAWRTYRGEETQEISLAEADSIAAALELPIFGIYTIHTSPAPEIYEISADCRIQLRAAVAALDPNEDLQDVCSTHIPWFNPPGGAAGWILVHTRQPVVDTAACDAVIAECEERAAKTGGWTTERHESYPTTDVPVECLPRTLAWFTDLLLPNLAYPLLARAFGFAVPSVSTTQLADAFRVSDAFVVKYDATAGQRLLTPHRDGGVFTFNVALNDLDDYEGGGTYFRALDDTYEKGAFDCAVSGGESSLRSRKGHILAHSSALMHGGHPIRSGVRYVLVVFVTVEPAYAEWAAEFYDNVRQHDGPEDHESTEEMSGNVGK